MSTKKITQIDIELALEDLVGQRFNKETLEAKLSTIFKQPIKVKDISKDDDELVDFNLLTNFDNEETNMFGYVDIYILHMRRAGFDGATMYITEIAVQFE
jgi:hypothetical protein